MKKLFVAVIGTTGPAALVLTLALCGHAAGELSKSLESAYRLCAWFDAAKR